MSAYTRLPRSLPCLRAISAARSRDGLPIVFSRQAGRDLEAIVRFLAQKNPSAAERIGLSLVDAALMLTTLPRRGALVRGRGEWRRVFHRPWVIIFFRIDESRRVVEVARRTAGSRVIAAHLSVCSCPVRMTFLDREVGRLHSSACDIGYSGDGAFRAARLRDYRHESFRCVRRRTHSGDHLHGPTHARSDLRGQVRLRHGLSGRRRITLGPLAQYLMHPI